MRIAVVGCGYLGAVHAASMASLGHLVVGIDVDAEKIARLSAGEAPFFEPGLPSLLKEQLANNRLKFSTDPSSVSDCEVVFIGVGTPQLPDSGAADIQYVDAAVDSIAPHLPDGALVVGKSTVPVGTARRLLERLRRVNSSCDLMWNPEFLRESKALRDTLEPDRLVYGVEEGERGKHCVATLDRVYEPILERDIPRLVVNLETSELVKVSANAFLATKISFINAMAEVCERVGGDVTQLAEALGHDARIGRKFLNSGLGFGGGCLPKDIRAFRARAHELGLDESLEFLGEVDRINLRRRERVIALAQELLGGSLSGRNIAVLGQTFKPNSDDLRDSPALDITRRLAAAGASVNAYDPEGGRAAARLLPEVPQYDSLLDAVRGAELTIVATEWAEFRSLEPSDPELRAAVARRLVIDARNCLDREAWQRAGWSVEALGRPSGGAVVDDD